MSSQSLSERAHHLNKADRGVSHHNAIYWWWGDNYHGKIDFLNIFCNKDLKKKKKQTII